MSMDEKFLGKIINCDLNNNLITVKVDFLTEEKKESLFELFTSGKIFSFVFKKAYKESKSYAQIKTYFMLISQILDKLDIPKDKDAVKAMDEYIMRSLWPCQMLSLFGQEVPIVPSKADLSKDEFSLLIQTILTAYEDLDLRIES